jgi:hypothetical protein
MKKIKETPKLSSFTNRVIKNNLLTWLAEASTDEIREGLEWYDDAQAFTNALSKKYSVDAYTVATVISCLSPNNKWERNKVDAEATIGAFTSGKFTQEEYLKLVKCCTYKANRVKAWRALETGEEIQESSPKTHAFAMNVGFLSSEHCTVDKWILRACQSKSYEFIDANLQTSCTIKQYQNIERIVNEIAKTKSLKAYELQAIVWITIKRVWER